MANDRFDLEQAIMACWNITSDLRDLSEEVIEGEYNADKVANVLIGLEQLYEIKFNKLFRIFETVILEHHKSQIELRNKNSDVVALLNEVRELNDRLESRNNPRFDPNDDETMGLRLIEDEEAPY